MTTVSACGDDRPAGASGNEIVIAEQATAGMATGLWPHLADDLGYFDDVDITVKEYISVAESSAAITGMESGSVQISHIGVEGMVAASKGRDIVGIGALMDASAFTVVANPKIKNWGDLDGEVIAVGSLTDTTRVIFDQIARDAGLDLDNLEYVAMGSTPNRLAAVQNSQAAATLAAVPAVFDALAGGGLTDLGYAPDGARAPQFALSEISASEQWATDHPEVVSNYLSAIKRAIDYARDPANTADAVRRISKLSGVSEEAARRGLELFLLNPQSDGYFPRDFNHNDDAFVATSNALTDLGVIDDPISEDDYMDYSYAKTAK